jgi:hypothetical protein
LDLGKHFYADSAALGAGTSACIAWCRQVYNQELMTAGGPSVLRCLRGQAKEETHPAMSGSADDTRPENPTVEQSAGNQQASKPGSMPDPDPGYEKTQIVTPGEGYYETMLDPSAPKHAGSDQIQHVDTMEFEEPDSTSIFTLEFPEIQPNTEAVFSKCFARLNDFMPALIYFQGEQKAGDRLIVQSYNDYHIPGEEE